MGDKKKKMISSIVDQLSGMEAQAPMEGAESESSYGKKAAMQRLISCVKAGDASGCVGAMEDFIAMVGDESSGGVEVEFGED
jgi:hypothetical protein